MLRAGLAMLLGMAAAAAQDAPLVRLGADRAAIGMGETVRVDAAVHDAAGAPLAGWRLVPYVNQRRWGAEERSNASGQATFTLPLPEPGPAKVEVLAYPPEAGHAARWVWAGQPSGAAQTVYLRKRFHLASKPAAASLQAVVDDAAELFINGTRIGAAQGWQSVARFDGIAGLLDEGENAVAIAASNGEGPAGVLARLEWTDAAGGGAIDTDDAWEAWTEAPGGWPSSMPHAAATATAVGDLEFGIWRPTMPAWPGMPQRDDWLTGRPMPAEGLRSEALLIDVAWRAMPDRRGGDTLFGVQWEPWFTPHNAYWQTAQAIPVMGRYDSFDRRVLRQHVLWFIELGIDFILPDWSNHLWGQTQWSARGDATEEIIHATELLLAELASMRDEGLPVPRVVLMPGLSNGPPTTIGAMNEMLDWLHHHYLRNPRFAGLWQDFDGRPLIVILDTATVAAKSPDPIDESRWTVRWMSTQLQRTRHERLGYWSWMDGSLYPVATYREGRAEAITVTPAYFGHGGWKYPEARGRRSGTTYIESFRAAIEHRPRVVLLHQWNEYAGQPEGFGHGEQRDIYVDSYDVELSDDIEPCSTTAPAYRNASGAWGYRYFNLTRALMDLYRGQDGGSTVLAVHGPERLPDGALRFTWSALGPLPQGVAVALDGETLPADAAAAEIVLPPGRAAPGPHRLRVEAPGAVTRYPLDTLLPDAPLAEPAPCAAEIAFDAP